MLRGNLQLHSFDVACSYWRVMKISIIIPVGDNVQWKECEKNLLASAERTSSDVDLEILPCFDLAHRGAYIARNEGLDRATGDWIAWVDCDDEVEVNWASEICAAIKAHPDVDVIQFDATEVVRGKTSPLTYRYKGVIEGERFAHELLRNDGMPAWLWTRVFRKSLFDGLQFEGRVKHDYGMFLQILPRIKCVWSAGKPLYRYNRHGLGLSNYAQGMDYGLAGRRFESLIEALPDGWRRDGYIGLALTMADVVRHSKLEHGARQWVLKYLRNVLSDANVPWRLKGKAVLAAVGI